MDVNECDAMNRKKLINTFQYCERLQWIARFLRARFINWHDGCKEVLIKESFAR
jgi:hypothetical protein